MIDTPAAIALVRTASLSSLVEAEVMRLILAGDLDSGEQIKEVKIAERLGVGRSSVREALRALEAAGLVRIEKNRGAFVRVVSEAEAREMYVVREALEGLAGALLAPRISDEEITELRARVDEMETYLDPADFHRYFPLNLTFHRRIFEMTGNGRLIEIYQRLTNELHTIRRNGLLRGGGLSVSNTEHRAIVEALAARDPAAASAALKAHVAAGARRRTGHREERVVA
ncbi:GntR family transcriptional regulator [Candidatus Raskinella chloraquaticus]|uniref:GntR family transcriptional regulator n=1 Tax=Candidatus Raskinella chloraquaticus TaxID=1951219 RepID=UPI0026A8D822